MTRSFFLAGLMGAMLAGPVPARSQTPPPATPPVRPPTQGGQSAPRQTPPPNPTAPASTPATGQPSTQEAPLAPTNPPAGMKSQIIQRVLVKVNGQAFTQTDLEQAQTQQLAATLNQQANVKDVPPD